MQPPGRAYYVLIAFLLAVIAVAGYALYLQFTQGLHVVGKNHPVGWAFYISTFVFWVGIAHSGTLISAVLFLFRVKWRAPIYRSAEAVTVFGLMTAGLFPILHVGRTWVLYWTLPYPQMGGLFPNFSSPLVWDVLAISTYMTVSVIFFFTGMVPDMAVIRDGVRGWRQKLYGFLAQGWQGTDRQWRHYTSAYLFLAALATPLVISVHSIVSWDFAMTIVPGWHSTIFAPYFVAGAIHSGLAMVILLVIPLRRLFNLYDYLTPRHLENVAKLMLLTSLILAYSYGTEFFVAWYSQNQFEQGLFWFRVFGEYYWSFYLLIASNILMPLLLFFKRARTSTPWLFIIALSVMLGMWMERFVIIVTSLSHDYVPFSWGTFRPTWVEIAVVAGSFALFFLLFLIFAKVLPVISMWEVKETVPPPMKKAILVQ